MLNPTAAKIDVDSGSAARRLIRRCLDTRQALLLRYKLALDRRLRSRCAMGHDQHRHEE
jgi:hypothetical protein